MQCTDGVSEVIGSIMLISLVVLAVAIVGVGILSQPPPVQTQYLDVIPGINSRALYLYHNGGDSLNSGDFFVRVDGLDYYSDSLSIQGGDWPWSIGEMLRIEGLSLLEFGNIQVISTIGGQQSVIASFGDPSVAPALSPPPPHETYTVTFNEQNSLEGVSIQVYADAGRTQPLGGPVITDENGQATRILPNGQYWYTASRFGYQNYNGGFSVAGSGITVGFTLESLPSYSITFNEQNNLIGVSIQLYADAARTQPLGNPVITDGSGQAIINLSDQNYWFTAVKAGYLINNGDFTVIGADRTVNFTMISQSITSIVLDSPAFTSDRVNLICLDQIGNPMSGITIRERSGDELGRTNQLTATFTAVPGETGSDGKISSVYQITDISGQERTLTVIFETTVNPAISLSVSITVVRTGLAIQNVVVI